MLQAGSIKQRRLWFHCQRKKSSAATLILFVLIADWLQVDRRTHGLVLLFSLPWKLSKDASFALVLGPMPFGINASGMWVLVSLWLSLWVRKSGSQLLGTKEHLQGKSRAGRVLPICFRNGSRDLSGVLESCSPTDPSWITWSWISPCERLCFSNRESPSSFIENCVAADPY